MTGDTSLPCVAAGSVVKSKAWGSPLLSSSCLDLKGSARLRGQGSSSVTKWEHKQNGAALQEVVLLNDGIFRADEPLWVPQQCSGAQEAHAVIATGSVCPKHSCQALP